MGLSISRGQQQQQQQQINQQQLDYFDTIELPQELGRCFTAPPPGIIADTLPLSLLLPSRPSPHFSPQPTPLSPPPKPRAPLTSLLLL
jgi:hypothetical protein